MKVILKSEMWRINQSNKSKMVMSVYYYYDNADFQNVYLDLEDLETYTEDCAYLLNNGYIFLDFAHNLNTLDHLCLSVISHAGLHNSSYDFKEKIKKELEDLKNEN